MIKVQYDGNVRTISGLILRVRTFGKCREIDTETKAMLLGCVKLPVQSITLVQFPRTYTVTFPDWMLNDVRSPERLTTHLEAEINEYNHMISKPIEL